MKFSIITLFPQMIKTYLAESIMKRAISAGHIEVEMLDLRDYTSLPHNQVDDYQFGGGKGMVLMCEPVVNAIRAVKTQDSYVILTSPQGMTWNQTLVRDYSTTKSHLIIVCGHYEGFDERILSYIDAEISVGDFVLTGGELASLVMLDSISRVVPGVIKTESHEQESFENNLLDYAVYTKPFEFEGKKVPDVLLSGHHANIQAFRDASQVENTYRKRPDLLTKAKLNKNQLQKLQELKGE